LHFGLTSSTKHKSNDWLARFKDKINIVEPTVSAPAVGADNLDTTPALDITPAVAPWHPVGFYLLRLAGP